MIKAKIDQNVPFPKVQKQRVFDYEIFKQMKIGDSFFIEGESTYSYVFKRIVTEAKRKGIKVSGRSVDGGLRVWRIE